MKAEYQDKLMHVIFCALAAMLVAVVIAHTTVVATPAILGGFLGGLCLGVGKEYGDYKNPNNSWSWGDFWADVLGAGIGCWAGLLTYAIW